jgi:hypothetical protein
LGKRKVRTYCEEGRCEKCGAEVSGRIENQTKTNCYFVYEVRMKSEVLKVEN